MRSCQVLDLRGQVTKIHSHVFTALIKDRLLKISNDVHAQEAVVRDVRAVLDHPRRDVFDRLMVSCGARALEWAALDRALLGLDEERQIILKCVEFAQPLTAMITDFANTSTTADRLRD